MFFVEIEQNLGIMALKQFKSRQDCCDSISTPEGFSTWCLHKHLNTD